MKILIVDDQEGIRRELKYTLEDEGYEAVAVGNGFEALTSFADQEFDIVITDLNLPDLSGMEILSKIKEDYPEIIVVMITAYGSEEKAVEAMKAGADDYIPKPIAPEEMLMKLTKAIDVRRLKDENLVFHRRLEAELDIARKIQQTLLPQHPPVINDLDIGIFNQPAKQVGGDYHDLIELPSGRLGIAIGDVSGKGMPAALLMANVQASIRRYSESVYSPKEIMNRINNALCPICQFIEEHRFITLFYGVLDPETRKLVYCNAGHNYPLIFRKNGAVHELSEGNGLPCGIIENTPYGEGQIDLEPDDIALFYTDGITEAMDQNGTIFSEEMLKNTVLKSPELHSASLITYIHDAVEKFIGNANQFDDMTLMVIKLKK